MDAKLPRSIKLELTISAIDGFQVPPGGDFMMWDTLVPAFGLRIKPTGTKSFILAYRNRHNVSRWITIARYGVKTPLEARKMARALLARVADGFDPAEQRADDRRAPTVEQLCTEYLERTEKGLILSRRGATKKASTLYVDRGRVARHIVPLLGRKPARDVTSADVTRFIRDVTAGKTANDVKTKSRGRSIVTGGAGTAARTTGLLGAIFSYAVAEGIVATNPVTGVVKPRDQRRSVRLDREGYRAFGVALEGAEGRGDNGAAINAARLLALTGARRSEILHLRWREVDLSAHVLRLEDSKTGASLRPIGRPAVDLLKQLKANAGHGEFVFPAQRAQPCQPDDKQRAARPFGGFPKAWGRIVGPNMGLSPHGLRHAFASTCDDLGLSHVTTGVLMGHVAVGGITGRYITKADATLLEAADRAATWIQNAMRGTSADVLTYPSARR